MAFFYETYAAIAAASFFGFFSFFSICMYMHQTLFRLGLAKNHTHTKRNKADETREKDRKRWIIAEQIKEKKTKINITNRRAYDVHDDEWLW